MQAKKVKTAAIACPICDGKLRGNYSIGYRCSSCYTHYTGNHTSWLLKNHLRLQIDAHFGDKKGVEETRVITEETQTEDNKADHAVITINPDEQKLSILISETQDNVHKNTKHLEDILQVQQDVQDKIKLTKEKLLAQKEILQTRIKNKLSRIKTASTTKTKKHKTPTKEYLKPKLTTIRIIKRKTTKSKQKIKKTKPKISSKSRTTKKSTTKNKTKSTKATSKKVVKKVSKKKKF